MKFLDKRDELQKNPLLVKLILFFTLSILLYLGADVLLHHHQIGLTLSTAKDCILGNEEEFLDPILFDSLLERTHFNILSSMMTLMTLTVILIRLEPKSKQILIHLTFLSAIFSHVVLLLTPTSEFFIVIWIGLFIFWHVLALFMGLKIMWKLIR